MLKLSNAADASKNVGQLTIPKEKFSLFKIVDSSNKALNYTMFEDQGEIRLNFKVGDAPKDLHFLSSLTNQTLSVQKADVYLTTLNPVNNTFQGSLIPQEQLKNA